MKTKLLLLLMPFLFFMATHIQAQERYDEDVYYVNESHFYAKILSGVNFLQNTNIDGNKTMYQTGYNISGAVGYCGRYGLRVEADL